MPFINRFVLEHPLVTCLILLVIALFFRLIDIFILKLDEKLGEIILSKFLGAILVILFLKMTGWGIKSIGFHTQSLYKGLFIGAAITLFALALGYLIEYVIYYSSGSNPKLYFAATDPKTGASGGVFFGLWLILGNFINSFMEEGLFRGLILKLLSGKYSFSQANWIQSFLFGGWHLPWVIKGAQLGQFKGLAGLAFGTAANFVPQLLMGFVWGYSYLKTNSLWTPWISHTLTNTTLNLLHIKTENGLDSGIAIRMMVYVIVMVLGILLINKLSSWLNMKELGLWAKSFTL